LLNIYVCGFEEKAFAIGKGFWVQVYFRTQGGHIIVRVEKGAEAGNDPAPNIFDISARLRQRDRPCFAALAHSGRALGSAFLKKRKRHCRSFWLSVNLSALQRRPEGAVGLTVHAIADRQSR
jgi:hypothetical protein